MKLHSDLLKVDLKEGIRKELETLAEARPFLRDSVGWLFQTIIPLDVHLSHVQSVELDSKGQVHVIIPGRRDIHIPLEPEESKMLIEKMNELVPIAKENAFRERQMSYVGHHSLTPVP